MNRAHVHCFVKEAQILGGKVSAGDIDRFYIRSRAVREKGLRFTEFEQFCQHLASKMFDYKDAQGSFEKLMEHVEQKAPRACQKRRRSSDSPTAAEIEKLTRNKHPAASHR
jgi:hypothetical protein